MDIPYGFDCYAFTSNELKYFEPNIIGSKSLGVIPYSTNIRALEVQQTYFDNGTKTRLPGYIRFTRKNEDYPREQLLAFSEAGRLNLSDFGKKIFCGIKIQLGIGVVTNFLRKGLLYRTPNKGKAELKNGTWTGIVSGLTVDQDAPNSYDVAFGNFLAWDEEYPYMKFGPFFAVESKLVLLTGSSRHIETSSFGTNIGTSIWLVILVLVLSLSVLASVRSNWANRKRQQLDQLDKFSKYAAMDSSEAHPARIWALLICIIDYMFIYFTMLLNKPSVEFDNKVWPKSSNRTDPKSIADSSCERLTTSIRALSYLWSAACFVMVSIYSGELLAVILLRTDQNIDTVSQLVYSKPPIEPVIRSDDFTYNLMLKSQDENMLELHNKTRLIDRQEVYTTEFMEKISDRKIALLGDDELIETIYDIYHKSYPLYRSKTAYLQYPISIMYRKDFSPQLELKLRRGVVQAFETGLIQRWYQAQKDTYIQFYNKYQKKSSQESLGGQSNSGDKYKPLSMAHFASFLRLMAICIGFAHLVLVLELLHASILKVTSRYFQSDKLT